MFSTDIFCLLFSIEAWLNQHMQNSQIHRASTLGFLIRGILDALALILPYARLLLEQ